MIDDQPAVVDYETVTPYRSGTWGAIAIAAALTLVLASSLVDVGRSNAALSKLDKQQAAAFAGARRAEGQLTALAKGVQQLADGGNANAAAIVATLQRNGLRIRK